MLVEERESVNAMLEKPKHFLSRNEVADGQCQGRADLNVYARGIVDWVGIMLKSKETKRLVDELALIGRPARESDGLRIRHLVKVAVRQHTTRLVWRIRPLEVA